MKIKWTHIWANILQVIQTSSQFWREESKTKIEFCVWKRRISFSYNWVKNFSLICLSIQTFDRRDCFLEKLNQQFLLYFMTSCADDNDYLINKTGIHIKTILVLNRFGKQGSYPLILMWKSNYCNISYEITVSRRLSSRKLMTYTSWMLNVFQRSLCLYLA